MIDSGRNETDRKLEELEKEIHGIYAQANKELQEKMTEYFRKFKKRDEEKQKQLENGEITAEEYKRWRMGQMATGSRWKSMCDVIAKDMHNSNAIARSVTQGHMAEIYAINHNWTTYDIENKAMLNTNYAMYNSDVVENLLKENPDILPLLRDSDGNVVREKDIAWNKKVINAVMLQGILQGESIDKMAKRFEEVGVRNEKAAVRYARTATTGAENAGRIDGYRRAQKLGIHVIKVWLATLDGRTRDSHRALDGEEQEVEKEFSNGCMHPGDPNCPDPSEVWNCRCTLITKVDGQNYDVSKVKRDSKLGDMSYDEWKNGHQMIQKPESLNEKFVSDIDVDRKAELEKFINSLPEDLKAKWIRNIYKCNFHIMDDNDERTEHNVAGTYDIYLKRKSSVETILHEVSHAVDKDMLVLEYEHKTSRKRFGKWSEPKVMKQEYKGVSSAAMTLYYNNDNSYENDLKGLFKWIGLEYTEKAVDVSEMKRRVHKKLDEFAEEYGVIATQNLSDMIDATTRGKLGLENLWGGHPRDYWLNATSEFKEGWAEYSALKTLGENDALEKISEILPDKTKVLKNMYEVTYNGGKYEEHKNDSNDKKISEEIWRVRANH